MDFRFSEEQEFFRSQVRDTVERLVRPRARERDEEDVFPRELQERFAANVAASGFQGELTTLVGPSQKTLRQLEPDSYDSIYIDGAHQADHGLVDAVLSAPPRRDLARHLLIVVAVGAG